MLKIQAILNKAGKRAVRWEWIGRNPFELTEPIPVPHSEPHPPTAEQAAVISGEAWRDLDWGMMIWLFMTTGARRGEICALRWDRFDPDAAVLVITSSIAQRGARTWEKDTKTHQQRRIALDDQTTACRQRVYDRNDARTPYGRRWDDLSAGDARWITTTLRARTRCWR